MRQSSRSNRPALSRALLAAAVAGWAAAPAAAAGPFQTGQSVEVREGDTWSAATVVRQEGRKYLVHYAGSDASTDEWVGPDRIRTPGGTAGAPAPAAAPSNGRQPAQPTPDPTAADDNRDGPPREVIPPVTPDRSAVAHARLAQPPAAWSVAPDPAAKSAAVGSVTLATHAADPKFHPTQLLPCRDGGAIVAFAEFGDKVRRVERVGTGAPAAQASLPAVSLPLAASPTGGLLVCRSHKFGFGNDARIDLYTLPSGPAGAATPMVSFTPYPDGDFGKPEDVRFAAAVSDTRIVTCDQKGRLVAWDVAAGSVRGVWRVDVGGPMHGGMDDAFDAVLSPGGHWLAAASPGVVTFVDPATGRVLGLVDTAGAATGPVFDLACSPSGKTLMAGGSGPSQDQVLVTIDVAAGRVTSAVPLPMGDRLRPVVGGLACVDDGFAVVGGRTLVDATTGAAVPAYQPASSRGLRPLAATGAGVTLLATDARLSAEHIPDAATRTAAASGADLVLKPGMSVMLDVQLDGLTDGEKASVEAAIRKKLADDKFVIADHADTTVVVRTEPGQPHEHAYGKSPAGLPVFLPPGSGTSMILTDKVTRVTITQGGATIWERQRVNGPAYQFKLKDGESLEDGAKATIKYDPQFLISLTIPAYVAKPATAAVPSPDGRRGRPGRGT